MAVQQTVPTLAELWQQEYQAFLTQENSQQILDNLAAIPNGNALLNTYIDLRISIFLVKEALQRTLDLD